MTQSLESFNLQLKYLDVPRVSREGERTRDKPVSRQEETKPGAKARSDHSSLLQDTGGLYPTT